jgi:hypothetical protein
MIGFGLRLRPTTLRLGLRRTRAQRFLLCGGFVARHPLELLGKPVEAAMDLVEGAARVR